jgi:hypothetical protein
MGMNPGCCDIPLVVSVPPILFPPLIFDEGCISLQEKTYNIIDWKCHPSLCGFCPANYCEAKCNVGPISLAYIPIYVYILSSLIVFSIHSFVNLPVIKNNRRKILLYFTYYLFWSLIGIFLIVNFIRGTWGIGLNLIGLLLFVIIPLTVLVYLSLILIKKYNKKK